MVGSCTENGEMTGGSDKTTSGGSGSTDQSQSPTDEPRQLIEFIRNDDNGNTTIKLQEDTIKSMAEKAGNRPMSVVCICGPSRQGKSFILSYMIQCLESLENGEMDWVDRANKSKPLEGFKFRYGTKPKTQGIWVWSRPFIIKNEEEKEVAVLLIDAQGTCDESTTVKDMSVIIGLSLLISSVMIFSCFNDLQEDVLTEMNTYSHYGQLVVDNSGDTPFQKLVFLILDWNNPGNQFFGSIGGKKFMEEKLKVKSDQPPEAKQVRESIRKCFKDLECFLMPGIGSKAKCSDLTDSSVSDLSTAFVRRIEEFINLISSEALITKEILGNVITVPELQSFLEKYLQVFNSEEIPSANSLWEATSDAHNINIVTKAVQKFADLINKRLRGSSKYLLAEELEETQKAAEKQAHKVFQKVRKFGSPEKISEYQEQLEQNLTKEWLDIKQQNEDKRNNFLNGVTSQATTQFMNLLEEVVPFDDHDDLTCFYEEHEIVKVANQAKYVVMMDIREKLNKESKETIDSKVQSVERVLEVTLQSYLNRNQAQKADAEKKMITNLENDAKQFEDQLRNFLQENKFSECDGFKKLKENLLASPMAFWKQRKHENGDFLAILEKELDSNHSMFENEQQNLKPNECQGDVEDQIQKICQDYEALLSEKAETVELEGELEQIHKQLLQKILQNFRQDGNPYPEGHSLHRNANEMLETRLKSIFERIRREVVNLQQRCEESYREALDHAVKYYDHEMKEVLNSSELISDEDLEMEHKRVYKETVEEFDDFEKIRISFNELNLKYELQQRICQQYDAIKVGSEEKRRLAHSKAKKLVNDFHSKYEHFMKKGMDKVKTEGELVTLHMEATREVKDMFLQECPGKEYPDFDFIKPYEEELNGEIEDSYEEMKDLLEMKRMEEEIATKALLDAQKKANDEKLKKYLEAAKKVNKNMKLQYTEKVEDMLKKNSDGLDTVTLNTLHTAIVKEVMKILEMEVRTKIGEDEPLEEHRKMLQIHIDNYWETVLDANRKNIKKRKESEKENKHHRKEKAEVQTKLNEKQDSSLPPLIFHLQSQRVTMAMCYAGRVDILQNELAEKHTPAYVVLTPENRLTYGSEAHAFGSPTGANANNFCWNLGDFFLSRNFVWNHVIRVDGRAYEICTEFLLAFLLRKLKHAVEQRMKGRCDQALLAIPFWLSSMQRMMVRDAAKLAGFSDVYLINEASAAAYHFALSEKPLVGLGESLILMASETLDHVDVFMYSYSAGGKKLTMVSRAGNYDLDEDDDKKTGLRSSLLFEKNVSFENYAGSFFSSSEPAPQRKIDDASQAVRDAFKVAIHRARVQLRCSDLKTYDAVYVCENYVKWRSILDPSANRFKGADYPVINGCAAFTDSLKEIGNYIQDKPAYDVLRLYTRKKEGGKVICKEDALPLSVKTHNSRMPSGINKVRFGQIVKGTEHTIGDLLVSGVGYNQAMEPALSITNEAVVYLANVLINTKQFNMKSETITDVPKDKITWTTPNLKREKFKDLKDLLEKFAPPPSLGDPALTEAKDKLLQKCKEMTEKTETEQFKFKSELGKSTVLQKIEEARKFTEHDNGDVEGVQNQMASLEKLCQRYGRTLDGERHFDRHHLIAVI